MSNLVSVGALMRELPVLQSSQRDFLRRFNVRSVMVKPHGRGYSHFITEEDAHRIVAQIKLKAETRQSPTQQAKAAQIKLPQPNQQVHIDLIETKESFWQRAKKAFKVLSGE